MVPQVRARLLDANLGADRFAQHVAKDIFAVASKLEFLRGISDQVHQSTQDL